MEPTSTFVDIVMKLGIGALSIFGMMYVIKGAQKEREQNQRAFMGYINANNHETKELVEKSTAAIMATTEVMKSHTMSVDANTKVTQQMLDALLTRK